MQQCKVLLCHKICIKCLATSYVGSLKVKNSRGVAREYYLDPSYNDDVATLFRFNLTSLINCRHAENNGWVINV